MDLDARFEAAVIDIEQHLKVTYSQRTYNTFTKRVEQARQEGRLTGDEVKQAKALWRIRNLMFHERYDGSRPVHATAATVVVAEQLCERLVGILPRLDVFVARGPVTTVSPDDTVATAVNLMQTYDFSYLPVVDPAGSMHGLVSSHDLVCWLGPQLLVDRSTAERRVGEVAGQGEAAHQFVTANLTQRAARRAFEDHLRVQGTPLAALLITDTGDRTGTLQGIVTPWDFPLLTPGVQPVSD